MTPEQRLEAIRLQLCSVGLHPDYHDTPEKAAQAVCEMIQSFRADLADTPHDLTCRVLKKLGVDGYTEDKKPTYKLFRLD